MNSKAVSPMIATILLIAFTVAVGGIISIWLTGFTRTQTAAAGAGAACTVNTVIVRALNSNYLSTNPANVTLQFLNQGTDSVTVTSLIITCGGSVTNSTSNLGLPVASNTQNTTTVSLSGSSCTTINLGIQAIAACSKGGTYTATCPEGTCYT
ncbi:MAG: archaellin/type IV pilin N-terminal domain-containing protein [Candidatus Aenigmatarchaeota archaeon]